MTNRFEICGNISSGKTTLCSGFAKKSCRPIFEDFLINPFLEKFYENPVQFAFETELTFLLHHYNSIKIQKAYALIVCDYSLFLDLAYADVNLTGNRHRIFSEIVSELQNEIGYPSRIIHLVCPEEVLLQRISARSRDVETSIKIDYLRALSRAISLRMRETSKKISVITINSHTVDFRGGINGIRELSSIMP
ncbi:MAG: deoxynucleoside kinase [Syntrophobacteraceae bacterium]